MTPATRTRFLHVANGRSTTMTIEAAGLPGRCSIWADPLYEGPVPGRISDADLLDVRMRYLVGPNDLTAATWAGPDPTRDPANDLREWRAVIDRHDAYDELVLWFEHDLFDQLNLIQLLTWIRDRLPATKPVSLICIGAFPGRPDFKGLGELTIDELAPLLETRESVRDEQYALARRAWEAFREPTPEALDTLRKADTSPLPYLAAAITRFLQEYPWTTDGLSRSERRLLELAQGDGIALWKAFPRMYDGERVYHATGESVAELAESCRARHRRCSRSISRRRLTATIFAAAFRSQKPADRCSPVGRTASLRAASTAGWVVCTCTAAAESGDGTGRVSRSHSHATSSQVTPSRFSFHCVFAVRRRMPLELPVAIDTRSLFRPVSSSLVGLLRGLPSEAWDRPTVAGTWLVRDVVAHLLDSTLRRLSFHRDGIAPPPPPRAIASEHDFVDFINHLNAQWVTASRRLSPRVLTDLYERASGEAADWFESLPFDAPALFPVSWAGEQDSAGWFDIGREFTELWHHQQQIRMAVGADALADPRYLAAVIDVAARGLPHAFRDATAEPGTTVVFDIRGASGGRWTLSREPHTWTLWRGEPPVPTTTIRLDDDTAWKLLFNALSERDAERVVQVEGRTDLGRTLLRARSVIV